jgi:hypothetical protein
MHQYNVRTPFKRITTDIIGLYPESEKRNQYLLTAMDYFTKWVEVYIIPNQEASTVWMPLWPTSSAAMETRANCTAVRAGI